MTEQVRRRPASSPDLLAATEREERGGEEDKKINMTRGVHWQNEVQV